MRITEKRAMAINLWTLCRYANNENCYYSTISTGFEDGISMSDLYREVQSGWYDGDLDEIIDLYQWALNRYKKYGFYFMSDDMLLSINEAIDELKKRGLWCSPIRKRA